jgi:membrane protein YdbS with pleckstrin-like domain
VSEQPAVIDALQPWPDAVDWRSVSPKLITVELIGRTAFTAVVLIGLGVGWILAEHWLWPVAMGVVVVLGIWRTIVTIRAVKAWGYAERDNDLLVRHGLLVRRLSIVPYARMQYVDVTAGPLERAFHLATVQLHTAAAASDARVPGLPPAEAARLRDRLTALGEDRAEGL